MSDMPRPCLTCGAVFTPTKSERSRCPIHAKQKARAEAQPYDPAWRQLSSAARADHGRVGVDDCPVCHRTYTTDNPSVLDHTVGGTTRNGVRVMCRECNGRKAGMAQGGRGR